MRDPGPIDAADDEDWLDRSGIGGDDATNLVWLRDAKTNVVWYRALAAVDDRGDKGPLIKLLQSGKPVPRSICWYIADLLQRYELKRPKARPRIPGYSRTNEQIKLIAALIQVHGRVNMDGAPLAATLKAVAAEFELDEETLTSAYIGKHGGLRRAMRYWYRP